MPGEERRVELADAVPLLGDETEVHRPPTALETPKREDAQTRVDARRRLRAGKVICAPVALGLADSAPFARG